MYNCVYTWFCAGILTNNNDNNAVVLEMYATFVHLEF